ncbi:MAG: hypothetical protein OXG82_15065 [Gammaproteobacteria bacterium]|nr:hypothetical protein [Gammaproteobacteria bacterium]
MRTTRTTQTSLFDPDPVDHPVANEERPVVFWTGWRSTEADVANEARAVVEPEHPAAERDVKHWARFWAEISVEILWTGATFKQGAGVAAAASGPGIRRLADRIVRGAASGFAGGLTSVGA